MFIVISVQPINCRLCVLNHSIDLNSLFSPAENNIHVHDLLTFQQITVVSKAKGATLFACDLQVRYSQRGSDCTGLQS